MHAIVTADCRNKYKSVCVCVFGTGEEEKEVNRDRGGLVSVIKLCVCDNKKATMVGGPAPTIVGNRSPPPYSILHQHDLHYTAMVL